MNPPRSFPPTPPLFLLIPSDDPFQLDRSQGARRRFVSRQSTITFTLLYTTLFPLLPFYY